MCKLYKGYMYCQYIWIIGHDIYDIGKIKWGNIWKIIISWEKTIISY